MDNIQIYNSDQFRSEENILKLLSVNKVSKILGIRFDSVKRLITSGQITFIKMNKRIKIPYISLSKFIEEQSQRYQRKVERTFDIEEISQKIDSLIAEYSGVNLN